MRPTLNIDDDVLATVRFLARQDARSVGAVLSELARRGLRESDIDPTIAPGDNASSPLRRKLASLGLVPFDAPDGIRVTSAMVNALRDAEGVRRVVTLLDVNVLIALCDAGHRFHRLAAAWFVAHASDGWASCPLTQNGAVRILSTPAYPNARKPREVVEQLRPMFANPAHRFWPDDIGIVDASVFRHGQLKDTDRSPTLIS